MQFKNSEIHRLCDILSKVKTTRLSNKDGIRVSFVKSCINLKRVDSPIQEKKDDIISTFQNEWKDELLKVRVLRELNQPVVGFDEFLAAEADANKVLNDFMNEVTEVDFTPVNLNLFVEALNETDDIDIESITVLCDNGILTQ